MVKYFKSTTWDNIPISNILHTSYMYKILLPFRNTGNETKNVWVQRTMLLKSPPVNTCMGVSCFEIHVVIPPVSF